MVPDANEVPLGTILPFPPDNIPEGWEVFDGRWLTYAHYPDLFDVIESAPAQVRHIWESMGGTFTHTLIRLPNPTSAEARAALFGNNPAPEIDFVLAIKAERPDNQ